MKAINLWKYFGILNWNNWENYERLLNQQKERYEEYYEELTSKHEQAVGKLERELVGVRSMEKALRQQLIGPRRPEGWELGDLPVHRIEESKQVLEAIKLATRMLYNSLAEQAVNQQYKRTTITIHREDDGIEAPSLRVSGIVTNN